MGDAIAAKDITSAIRKVHDFTTVCAPTPLQRAAVEALKLPQSYYTALAKDYQKRRDFIVKSLRDVGFDPVKPEGAYYVLANFSALSKKDDVEFARYLVEEASVASVPGSSFYAHPEMGRKSVRFHFSKKDKTLREAADRLATTLTK